MKNALIKLGRLVESTVIDWLNACSATLSESRQYQARKELARDDGDYFRQLAALAVIGRVICKRLAHSAAIARVADETPGGNAAALLNDCKAYLTAHWALFDALQSSPTERTARHELRAFFDASLGEPWKGDGE